MLKSDTITVSATDEHGAEVAVDVPAIQSLVGAKVAVKPSGSSTSTLAFTGQQPITFGFIVDEIEYDGTRWSLRGAAPSGALAFSAGASGQAGSGVLAEAPILLGTGCRIRV